MVAELAPATGIEPADLSSLCHSTIEHAPLPMASVAGASHIVRSVNPAFCRLINKAKDELVGIPFCEVLPENANCVTLLDRVFRTGKPERYTEQELSKPYPVFWSYTLWPVMANARPVGIMIQVVEATQFQERTLAVNEALVLGSVRQHELTEVAERLNEKLRVEITARKKTARELAEKARLLDLSNDAIIVLDLDCRILYWNHGAEELYGWPGAEALGKVSHELLQTECSIPVEQITEELHRTDRWAGELVQTKRDGQRITVLARKALDRDSQGSPAAILEHMTDITERVETVAALRRAQVQLADHSAQLEGLVAERTAELTATNKQLETLVYSIAHDLRAPLRAMQGFSTMLVAEVGSALNETGKGYADRINKSAQFMDAMLIDLLALSRISQQRVELTPVSLEPVVALVLSRLQKVTREKHAHVESSGTWPVVLAHEPTLAQVLFNLVGNALKFGTPDVPPVMRLRAEDQAGFVRVWVEDNGIGIEPTHQAQVFRQFARLNSEKYEGTGIGLAIVHKGIERMGGRVGVESAAGQGSRFWFELRKA